MNYIKENPRVYKLHAARFMSIFKDMDLRALKLRHMEAKNTLLTVGLTDETCAKCDVLLRLIESREAIAKNPHYEAISKAIDALGQFDAEVRELGKSVQKAFREVARCSKKIEKKIEGIHEKNNS